MKARLLKECQRYVASGGDAFDPASFGQMGMLQIDPAEINRYLNQNRSVSFSEQLFMLIDQSGLSDTEVYKKALMDRRLFSKIRSGKDYIPSKRTVIALCFGLQLKKEEALELLSCAGYGLSSADAFDLVISFCLENQVYDLFDVNEALLHFGLEPFGKIKN